MVSGTLRKPKAVGSAEYGERLVKGMGELGQGSLILAPTPGSALLPSFHPGMSPNNPEQGLPPRLQLPPLRGAKRAGALPRPSPTFHVSLPSLFLLGSSSAATIGQRTS